MCFDDLPPVSSRFEALGDKKKFLSDIISPFKCRKSEVLRREWNRGKDHNAEP
jgi:hypothetical protein